MTELKQLIENMDDEVRCDYLVTAKMKQVWNIQLNMAVRLIEVCKKYNLKIWADSGTLLGTVRHKGFIPWDDDMDFVMLREDYDKLQKIAPKEFRHPFFFQTFHTDRYYFDGFAKIRYDESCMIDEYEYEYPSKKHMGIAIDIFVLDKVPKEPDGLYKLNAKVNTALNFMRHRAELKYAFLPHRLISMMKEMFRLKNKIFWSNRKLSYYIEKLLRNNSNTSDLVSPITFSPKPKLKLSHEMLGKMVFMPFEKTELPVSPDYSTILTQYYGDYKSFVKGTAAHKLSVLDTEKSYKYYLNIIKINYFKLYKDSFKLIIGHLK